MSSEEEYGSMQEYGEEEIPESLESEEEEGRLGGGFDQAQEEGEYDMEEGEDMEDGESEEEEPAH